MRVIVRYTQEVWAEVETAGEEKGVEHAYSTGMRFKDVVVDDGRRTPASRSTAKRALEIAENTMWPSWR